MEHGGPRVTWLSRASWPRLIVDPKSHFASCVNERETSIPGSRGTSNFCSTSDARRQNTFGLTGSIGPPGIDIFLFFATEGHLPMQTFVDNSFFSNVRGCCTVIARFRVAGVRAAARKRGGWRFLSSSEGEISISRWNFEAITVSRDRLTFQGSWLQLFTISDNPPRLKGLGSRLGQPRGCVFIYYLTQYSQFEVRCGNESPKKEKKNKKDKKTRKKR